MDVSHIIVIAVVLAAAGALQGATGFGYGMVAVPLIALTGAVASYEAIAIVMMSVVAQTGYAVFVNRTHLDPKLSLLMIAVASATLPLGVAAHGALHDADPGHVKAAIGAFVLLAVVALLVVRPRPRSRVPWPWGVLAWSASGVTSGLAGMGGPPAVLWVMAHDWPANRSRVALWALFLGVTPVQMVVLWLRFGGEVITAGAVGVAMWPAVILGTWPGLLIGRRFDRHLLRRLSYALLVAVALYTITSSLL